MHVMTSRLFFLINFLLLRLCSSDDALQASMQEIWMNRSRAPLDVGRLREDTFSMFNHGFQSYLRVAWPHDNLLPSSCKGQDWQGGMGLTLVDSLDALLLMGRRADFVYVRF